MRIGSGLAALAVSLAIAEGAFATEIDVKSAIDGVTVYPAGAEVERLAKLKLAPGTHTLIFRDLPANAIAHSIRVDGKATGPLEIGSVDTRSISVPSTDPEATASNRRRIEDEIEKLGDERTTYLSEIEVAEAQKAFANNLVRLPGAGPSAPVSATQPSAREDWQQLSNLIVSQVAAAEKAIHAAKIKIRTVERKIEELKQKLANEAPKVERRTEVKVFVNARAALDADLVVHYQVRNASWRAHYDARLMTGSRTVPPALTIVRRGTVAQTTGEDWSNIRLALSTTRPTAGTAAPVLRPVTVDYERPRPVPRRRSPVGTLSMKADDAARRLESEPAPAVAAPSAEQAPIVEVSKPKATTETSTFQAIFRVPARVTVPTTGDTKRVLIDEDKVEPQLKIHTVPRLDQRAFLYVKLQVPKSGPYLAGPIALFRDSTFVGNGFIPQRAAGEDHELGFGSDDAVRVRFAVAKETRGEMGIISSSATNERNYRITLKNLHERPVAFTVVDRIPVSLNEEIRVEPTFKPMPAHRNLDDQRGVTAWEGTLSPGAEQVVEVGYRVIWPTSKTIEYGR